MRNLLIALSLILTTGCLAQNVNQKIIDVYGETYYNNLVENNPGAITHLTTYVENGMELHGYNEKYAGEQMLTEIPLRSKTGETISIQQFISEYTGANFNPLKYGFNSAKDVQVFRLNGDSRVLIIYSLSQIVD